MSVRKLSLIGAMAATSALALSLACAVPQPPDRSRQARDADENNDGANQSQPREPTSPARVTARPDPKLSPSLAPGRHRVGPGGEDAAILIVPRSAPQPTPLVLMLHGAGGNAVRAAGQFENLPQKHGFAVLSVKSEDATWDAVFGRYGPDVDRIEAALSDVFARLAVDPQRVAVAGFSDGGTYALSLGLANGDLFRAVMALSPGFVVDAPPVGKPRIFVSHGTTDRTLPIDATSRKIVPRLKSAGYDVTYVEFDGGHQLPLRNLEQAVEWWLQDGQ